MHARRWRRSGGIRQVGYGADAIIAFLACGRSCAHPSLCATLRSPVLMRAYPLSAHPLVGRLSRNPGHSSRRVMRATRGWCNRDRSDTASGATESPGQRAATTFARATAHATHPTQHPRLPAGARMRTALPQPLVRPTASPARPDGVARRIGATLRCAVTQQARMSRWHPRFCFACCAHTVLIGRWAWLARSMRHALRLL